MRDILHYTDEEIRNLSLVDYRLALVYSLETYTRRDVLYILNNAFKKKGSGKGEFGFMIEHPEIEKWIRTQYED